MPNSPYDDDRLQGCPMRNCEGQAEINPETDLVTCSESGCVLFYDENAVTVEVWEALPREAQSPPAPSLAEGIAGQFGHILNAMRCDSCDCPADICRACAAKEFGTGETHGGDEQDDPDCDLCHEWLEKRHKARQPTLP